MALPMDSALRAQMEAFLRWDRYDRYRLGFSRYGRSQFAFHSTSTDLERVKYVMSAAEALAEDTSDVAVLAKYSVDGQEDLWQEGMNAIDDFDFNTPSKTQQETLSNNDTQASDEVVDADTLAHQLESLNTNPTAQDNVTNTHTTKVEPGQPGPASLQTSPKLISQQSQSLTSTSPSPPASTTPHPSVSTPVTEYANLEEYDYQGDDEDSDAPSSTHLSSNNISQRSQQVPMRAHEDETDDDPEVGQKKKFGKERISAGLEALKEKREKEGSRKRKRADSSTRGNVTKTSTYVTGVKGEDPLDSEAHATTMGNDNDVTMTDAGDAKEESPDPLLRPTKLVRVRKGGNVVSDREMSELLGGESGGTPGVGGGSGGRVTRQRIAEVEVGKPNLGAAGNKRHLGK